MPAKKSPAKKPSTPRKRLNLSQIVFFAFCALMVLILILQLFVTY